MSYMQGFVIAVPKAKKAAYLKMVEEVAPLFEEYGALRMVECWGDDVPKGEQTDFYRAVDAKPDEVIVFSWIEWPDKATSDKASEAMYTDKRFTDPEHMPMDPKRMIWGNFVPIFDSATKK